MYDKNYAVCWNCAAKGSSCLLKYVNESVIVLISGVIISNV